jgi:uncharacterized membrane protein
MLLSVLWVAASAATSVGKNHSILLPQGLPLVLSLIEGRRS